jgi:hypothetical protein
MRLGETILHSLEGVRFVWLAANVLAFALFWMGYGQSFCGVGYTPTWMDLTANGFLCVVVRPLSFLPEWIYSPNGSLLDVVGLVAPRLADQFTVACMLAANYQLISLPSVGGRQLIRRAMSRSRPSPAP